MDLQALKQNEAVYEKEYLITAEMEDANGRCKAAALARIMQDITETHMSACGINLETWMENHLIWVIVCSQIEINRLPCAGEPVEVYSWAGEEKFGMYSRRYMFCSKTGEELIRTSSLFSLVDNQTRTMNEQTKGTVSLPIAVFEEEQKLPKITRKFPVLCFHSDYAVQENEIDWNGHVNNACYLDWAENLLDVSFGAVNMPKIIWIQYEKEVLAGQKVVLQHANENGTVFVKGCIKEESYFKIMIETHEEN